MTEIKNLKTVTSAIKVLICLSEGALTLSDLSRKLNLNKSTVYRLLKTLESSEMVTQDIRTRQYHLGYMTVNIAYSLINSHEKLSVYAFEEMRKLRDLCGETVQLFVNNATQYSCLEEIRGIHGVKLTIGRGSRVPLYVGATSIVLASFYTDEELDKLTRYIEFTPFTSYSITDSATFIARGREARHVGWACMRSDYALGAVSVSVPVKNYFRPLALSILGPEAGFGEKMMDFIPEMQKNAETLSNKIREEGWTLM